jgi:hypothetical protein
LASCCTTCDPIVPVLPVTRIVIACLAVENAKETPEQTPLSRGIIGQIPGLIKLTGVKWCNKHHSCPVLEQSAEPSACR